MNILKIIENFELSQKARFIKLKNYYLGKNDILKTAKEANKPNNKISNNYARNIVSNTTGYFLGKAIIYNCTDMVLGENIRDISSYNDDDFHNNSLGTDLSIYGVAYELIYINSDKKIRYAKLDPLSTFVKYSDDLEKTIEYAIRYYDVSSDNNVTTRYVEYYNKSIIRYYTIADNKITLTQEQPHYFGDVPVNIYRNNENLQGDFETVISLIDGYDKMESESLNDFETFADAYLVINNMEVDDTELSKIRDNKIFLTSDNGSASWLTKNVNDAYIENIKNRLDNDIYKFSNTVNMSDENFSNNSSGVAIKYKLMNFENRISITERYFEKGLTRRWELICNMLNVLGNNYDYTSITYVFTRNIPLNLSEISTMLTQLQGIVSNETLLSQLPFIDDAQAEMAKLQSQNGEYSNFEGIE